jgi:hypothetical protein
MAKTSFGRFGPLLPQKHLRAGGKKAGALPSGARRLEGRVVRGAQFAFIGAKRETLDRRRGVQARVFSKKGKNGGKILDG